MPVFLKNWDAPCILCLLSPPMFAYDLSTFSDNARRFVYLLPETAMIEITIMFFVCFIQDAEYGAAKFFLQACL